MTKTIDYKMKNFKFVWFLMLLVSSAMAQDAGVSNSKNQKNLKKSPSAMMCTSNSAEGSFILCEKTEGRLVAITQDLFIVSRIESNVDQPIESRGPYQCNESTSLYRLSKPGLLGSHEIFEQSTKKIVASLKKEAQKLKIQYHVSDDELKDIIESLQFRFLNKKEFNLIDITAIAQTCDVNVFENPLPTKILFPFFSEYMKSQLK